MKKISLLGIISIMGCWLACQNQVAQNQTQQPPDSIIPVEVRTGAIPELVKGSNMFALELFKAINKDDQNLFYSPFSISTALAMTYAGARGTTEKEIGEVMHFSSDQAQFHPEYALLLDVIDSLNRPDSVQLSNANSLFLQQGYEFLPEYLNLLKQFYKAKPEILDFKNDTEKSRGVINKWVAKNTQNKIEELLKPGSLNNLTRLVLVNAIYFLGNWEKTFAVERTAKLPFFTAAGQSYKTDFMSDKRWINIYGNDMMQAIELRYSGEDISMVIFLPRDHDKLKDLETAFTADQVLTWCSKMGAEEVNLHLPKFTIRSTFDLSDILEAQGMKSAFSLTADFSGMTGKSDLEIDKIIHEAVIEVSEKGTEAAAATAVVIMEKTAVVRPVTELRIDRPFLFIIKENKYNCILFAGKVTKP